MILVSMAVFSGRRNSCVHQQSSALADRKPALKAAKLGSIKTVSVKPGQMYGRSLSKYKRDKYSQENKASVREIFPGQNRCGPSECWVPAPQSDFSVGRGGTNVK